MDAITYTEARENFAQTIQRVCRDHDPVIITRRREDSVVMIALEDYDSLTETAYLLKRPKNASRLLASLGKLEKGKGRERKLVP
jgi:antitoxin YefM